MSDAFTRELEEAEISGITRNSWVHIEATNFATFAREVSGFAADRDRLASLDVTTPVPWQVLALWPHFIAVAFALSLAKAIATYSLL